MPAPAATQVHWHIAYLAIDAGQLGNLAPDAIDAALTSALTQRLAGVHEATPARAQAPWLGAVAEALAARLPSGSSATQP